MMEQFAGDTKLGWGLVDGSIADQKDFSRLGEVDEKESHEVQ